MGRGSFGVKLRNAETNGSQGTKPEKISPGQVVQRIGNFTAQGVPVYIVLAHFSPDLNEPA